eukprot:TRINITY_DN81043_c0_g1_i1.p1 TRINITY_DN81043_c0_g1~~TRINITY_DN81043_c0_g1_i1.p1  ORF type:complete len:354 (+),score=67.39 TRINITY_DN81043_c0_g1_i1:96-1157(+)
MTTPRCPPRVGSMASSTMRRRVLASAALGEWPEVRKAVDEEGCSTNIQDETTGLSLVHWAAHQGDLEHLSWLQSKGAFLRLRDQRGQAPLAGVRSLECRELLLKSAYSAVERVLYGSATDGSAVGGVGGSAPFLPLVERMEAEVSTDGIDEPLWDEDGANLATCLAARHGQAVNEAQASIGGEEVFNVVGEEHPRTSFNAMPGLRSLVAKGSNFDFLDENGNALLHHVDYSLGFASLEALLRFLLEEVGVRHYDHRNRDGDTPVLLCSYQAPSGGDALRCLKLFEAAGANLALGNAKGANAPMFLARYHGDGPWLSWCSQVAGVEPSARCVKGRTVADYIALYEAGHQEDEDD